MNSCLICSDNCYSHKVGSDFDLIKSLSFLFKSRDEDLGNCINESLADCYYCLKCLELLQSMTPTIEEFIQLEKQINAFRKQIEDLFYQAQQQFHNTEGNKEIEIKNFKIRRILSKDLFSREKPSDVGEDVRAQLSDDLILDKEVKIEEEEEDPLDIDDFMEENDTSQGNEETPLNSLTLVPSIEIFERQFDPPPQIKQRTNWRKLDMKNEAKKLTQQETEFLKLEATRKTISIRLKRVEEISPEELQKLHNPSKILKTYSFKSRMVKSPEFKCQYENCNFSSFAKLGLDIHIEDFHEKETKPLSLCSVTFETSQIETFPNQTESNQDSEYEIESGDDDDDSYHEGEDRIKSKRPVKNDCKLCNKTFTSWNNLRIHRKFDHDIKDEIFSCDECPKMFKNQRNLSGHKKRIHSKEIPICPICSKQTSEMKSHIETVHGEGNFPCDKCERSFKCRRYLISHKKNSHMTHVKLTCHYCGKIFSTNNKQILNDHIASNHELTPHDCEHCGRKYNCRKHYLSHKRMYHSENPKYYCEICKKAFSHRIKFENHKDLEHNDKTFSCEECGKEFKTRDRLANHKKHHHGSEVMCEICQKRFKTQKGLKLHMEIHRNRETIECDKCDKTFKHVNYLKNHQNTVHALDTEKAKRKCSLCDKVLANEKLYRLHKRKMHHEENEERTCFNCEICGDIFNAKGSLARHLNQIHSIGPDMEKPSTGLCTICGKTVSSLNAHLKIHSKDKITNCEICGISLSIHSLKRHIEQKHPDPTKEFKCSECEMIFPSKLLLTNHGRAHAPLIYKCDLCPMGFKTKTEFSYHKETHIGGPGKFQCPIEGCGKMVKRKSALKRHLRIHRDERPHSCTTCGKSFRTRIHLRTHSAVHSDARPFLCSLCGASFKIKIGLNQHMRGTHGQKGKKQPIANNAQQSNEALNDSEDDTN